MGHDTTRTVRFSEVKTAAVEACLVLIYGAPELGRRFPMHEHAVAIGRDPSNQIIIDEPDVSRQHAKLVRQGDAWYLEDLESRNGTWRNAQRLTDSVPLHNGDLIKIGGVIFKYIAGGNVESLFHEEIYRMTVYDGLTRAANKRYLLDFLDREVARAHRYHSPLSVAMVDVDLFKHVNDTWGHAAGDYVLEHLASVIAKRLSAEELLARYGGEEFALVLPEHDRSQGRTFCETLREAVANERFEHGHVQVPVTVSIGVATYEPGMSRDEMLRAADEQLYRAKRAGRNCVRSPHHP
jgi:diguanylate cyclase (GGDEF)-like protein